MKWAYTRFKLWQQYRTEQRQKATERIAHTFYQRRVKLNRAGDQQNDWTTAEKIVKNPVRRILFASRQPTAQTLKFITWHTPRWFLFSLPHLEWVKLLAVPLVIAAAGTIITGEIQREANQNAVLKAYFDKLEELTFEQKLLAEKPNEGAIVLARGRTAAALRELDLPKRASLIAFLQASGLSYVDVDKKEVNPIISFKNQNLVELDLRGIKLSRIDFSSARLRKADLQDADLGGAILSGADLQDADLGGAILSGAELYRVNLVRANLRDADLRGAKLEGADLSGAKLEGADLSGVNLSDVSGLNDEQLGKAILCGTLLPEDSDLKHNQNCPK